MKFHSPSAEVYIPDGAGEKEALARTTCLAVSAHQDDLEIMAAEPILRCYRQPNEWFTGVVLTDGRGSPRIGLYANYTDDEMHAVRMQEQKKAAAVGEYSAQILLDYPSRAVKNKSEVGPVEDLHTVLLAAKPKFVFTHNLADKHDTHVGTALRLIAAIRRMPKAERPQRLYGCEVWRDLDWLNDSDKVVFDLTAHEALQASLLGVFDSQIAGGKRYDLASLGRRRANATYFESHGVDISTGMSYAMDLTALVQNDEADPAGFVLNHIRNFSKDVEDRLARLA
jgi:LmbE family N-acetylglucosaminyl deacetylase